MDTIITLISWFRFGMFGLVQSQKERRRQIPILTLPKALSYQIKIQLNTHASVYPPSSSSTTISLRAYTKSTGAQLLRPCLSLSNSQVLHALLTFSTSLTHASTVLSLPYPSANSLSSTPQSEPPPLQISAPPHPPRCFTLLTALALPNRKSDPS